MWNFDKKLINISIKLQPSTPIFIRYDTFCFRLKLLKAFGPVWTLLKFVRKNNNSDPFFTLWILFTAMCVAWWHEYRSTKAVKASHFFIIISFSVQNVSQKSFLWWLLMSMRTSDSTFYCTIRAKYQHLFT